MHASVEAVAARHQRKEVVTRVMRSSSYYGDERFWFPQKIRNQEDIKMSNKGNYYIPTAIAYTSGKPHIGNTYEIVLADAIWKVMMYISRQGPTSTDRRFRRRQRLRESHRRNMWTMYPAK